MILVAVPFCVEGLIADSVKSIFVPMIECWPVPAMILQPDIAAIQTPVVQLLLNIGFVRQTLLGQVVTSAIVVPNNPICPVLLWPRFLIYNFPGKISLCNQMEGSKNPLVLGRPL